MATSNVFLCAVLVVSAITQIYSAPPSKYVDLSVLKIEPFPKEKFAEYFEGKVLEDPNVISFGTSLKSESQRNEIFRGEPDYFPPEVDMPSRPKPSDALSNDFSNFRKNSAPQFSTFNILKKSEKNTIQPTVNSKVQKEPVKILPRHQPGTEGHSEPSDFSLEPITNTGNFEFDMGYPKFMGRRFTIDESGHPIPSEFYPRTAEEAKDAAKNYGWMARYEGVRRVIYEIPRRKKFSYQSIGYF